MANRCRAKSPLFVTRHARPWLTLQNSLPAVRGSACVCGWELRGHAGVPPPPAIPPAPKRAAATRCAPSSALRPLSAWPSSAEITSPLRAAGAQPRAGHLRIHHDEANGPKSDSAPRPGGRRVHLGSACWGGRRCASPLSGRPRGVGGRASGGNSLLVSRAAAAPFIRPLVMSFRFCIVSRPLASRGAPERHVYWCWLRVRNGLFLTRNQLYYTRTPSGGTRGACASRQGGVAVADGAVLDGGRLAGGEMIAGSLEPPTDDVVEAAHPDDRT